MKLFINNILSISLLAFLFLSCSKDDDTSAPEPSNMTVSTSDISFTSTGGSQSFSVNSNVDWALEIQGSWISANPTSGSGSQPVNLSATSNSSSSSRSGSVTVSSEADTFIIAVNQEGSVSDGGGGGGGGGGGNQEPQFGTITFHKSANNFDTIELYVEGSFIANMGPDTRHASPNCETSGCIHLPNKPHGLYHWEAKVYNAAGTAVVKTAGGITNLNSSCRVILVQPN